MMIDSLFNLLHCSHKVVNHMWDKVVILNQNRHTINQFFGHAGSHMYCHYLDIQQTCTSIRIHINFLQTLTMVNRTLINIIIIAFHINITLNIIITQNFNIYDNLTLIIIISSMNISLVYINHNHYHFSQYAIIFQINSLNV